jgi:hypothetical protein
MEVQDTPAAIYSEAKSEYTKQLVFNFQPTLLRFFLDRYTEAKVAQSVVSKTKSALSEFQESLSQIPEWNLDKVQRETSTLLESVHCDYMEDLITAVFIAHTKILSAIRLNARPRQKIRITVPKPDHFMHRALSECSRLLWSNVYLFSDSVSSLDRQKNMNNVNQLIEEGLLQAIRNLLPVKSILRDSLQDDEHDIQIQNDELKSSDSFTPIEQSVENTIPPALESTKVSDTGSQGLDLSFTPHESVAQESQANPESVVVPEVSPSPPELLPVNQSENSLETKGLHLTPDAYPRKAVSVEKQPEELLHLQSQVPVQPQNTLVVETERTVGFTGIDSVFGTTGDAELRQTVDEASDEFKILGDLESLDTDEFEDLDTSVTPMPLGSDDYESI